MRAVGGLLIALGFLGGATAGAEPAFAGAWNLPKGQGQAIVKYEDMHADQGFDPNGDRVDLSVERRDQTASVYAEYGLTDRLTLQFKGEWQRGRDAFVDFEGRGPVEIGARWQVWRDERSVVAVYGGYADGGEGRNAGYAPPGAGNADWEARLMAGRSMNRALGGLIQGGFVEAQVARRWRQGLPDEVRLDLTMGTRLNQDWTFITQAFGGLTDGDGARWLSLDTSVVRDFGDWSLQAGWRQSVAGREIPAAGGPVVGIWRRF